MPRKIRKNTKYENIFIPSAPSDAGGSIGSALNLYFNLHTEKKHFLGENENRKWISKKNIKNYSFPKANHKLFKKLELNNWYA